jgi:pimeloyl-ACP methyl ester carboxylesterase
MPFESTPTLKIAYEAGGPSNGFPVVLLHGWPDDVRTYDRVVAVLNAAGFRTVVLARVRRYVLPFKGDDAFWRDSSDGTRLPRPSGCT